MRSFNSWRVRLCAVALAASTLAVPYPAKAQFATVDIPHIGVQVAEFAKKAAEWVDHLKNFQVVRDAYAAAQTANNISNGISRLTDQVRDLTNQGLALQQRIQADLRKVQNIRGLRVSNMTDLKNLALNVSSLNLASALPSVGQTQRFTQALTNGTDADALYVKDALASVSTNSGTVRTAAATRQQQTTATMSQLALENKTQQDKVTQAFQYKRLADELTTSATELQTATNTDNALVMTDGERITTQARVADMYLKAQELREKSSKLLAEATVKGPAQRAAEQVIAEQQQVAGFNVMHYASHPNEVLDY